ncbi:MAG: acylneuraminate cytidylyltransferase family protein [Alphaproteobacteria bacterium]|jgi:CMP-N,N'-diacetyllegionaminic acid synthase|nr:acylneuraminate cytidylyltransferase family protein [Alphaproteobacteria bacterium]MDC3311476.1 acylneuraminate cytidylyltransferase family protein [Alphaproteobacteria bacterium]
MKLLAIITARGGSKRLPGKNTRLLGGKPLIAWTIQAALLSKYITKTILSSDDQDIIHVAKEYGCDVPFVRSPLLAQDNTTSIEVVLDAIDRCPGYDWVLLLQPTSPFRTSEDIDAAVEYCMQANAFSCVSLSPIDEKSNWLFISEKNKFIRKLKANFNQNGSQNLTRICKLNGAIYLSKIDWLRSNGGFVGADSLGYEMPNERSVDIDTFDDFAFAEAQFR